MTVLTDAAEQAYLAREAAQEAARDEERKALRQGALDAMRAMLVREDGTSMTLSEAGLEAVHTDLPNRLVVASDGTVALAASDRNENGTWVVRLVTGEGTKWSAASERLASLADLGNALAARA